MNNQNHKTIGVGLVGLGAVGTGFVRVLSATAELVRQRAGVDLQLRRVADKDLQRPRDVELPPGLLTDDARSVVEADDVDVVVELIGGVEPARSFALEALRRGKSVVTANKELVANAWDELHAAALRGGAALRYSASAGGAVPVVPVLLHRIVGDEVHELLGILNGTCNFVLTRMEQGAHGLDEAVAEAQRQGFAEADPSDDVSGRDAARKLAILARLAFGASAVPDDIPVQGIEAVRQEDIAAARRYGFALRLLAVARKGRGGVALRVAPAFLPLEHPLAAIRGENNAVHIGTRFMGGTTLAGKGAGPEPTGAAVLADVVDAALRPLARPNPCAHGAVRLAPCDAPARAYLRFPIEDRPGMVGRLAAVLGARGIDIESAHATLVPGQPGWGHAEVFTRAAAEGVVADAFRAAQTLAGVGPHAARFRIEGEAAPWAAGAEGLAHAPSVRDSLAGCDPAVQCTKEEEVLHAAS